MRRGAYDGRVRLGALGPIRGERAGDGRAARERRWRIAVAAAVLFAAAVRIVDLASTPPGLHFDEAVYGLMAKDIVAGARPVFFPAFTGREPLYMYCMALLFAGAGPTAFALRLTSAFAGVVTVALAGAVGRGWFGRRVGVAAAWILAANVWHLTVSRNGYPNILIPPLELVSALFLLRAWRRARAVDAAIGGAFVGLVLYTYLAARFWPVTVGVWLVAAAVLAPRRVRARAAPIGVALAAAAAVFAPLAAHFVRHPADFWERANQVLASRTLSGADLWRAYASNAWRSAQGVVLQGKGDPRWHYNLPGRPMLGLAAAALFAIGLVACLRRARDVRYTWLILWLVGMAIPGILTMELQPAGQRMFGITPALALVAALGARALLRAATSAGRSLDRRREIGAGAQRFGRAFGAAAIAVVALAVAAEAVGGVRGYRAWAAEPATAQVFNADYAAMARLAQADVGAGRTVVVLSEHYRHPTLAFLAPDVFDRLVWTDPERALPVPAPRSSDAASIVYLRPRSYARDALPAVAWLEAHAARRDAFAADGIRAPRPIDAARSLPDPEIADERDRPPTAEVVRYVVLRTADPSLAGDAAAAAGAPPARVPIAGEIVVRGVDGAHTNVPRNRPLVVPIDFDVLDPPAGSPGRQLVVQLVGRLESAPSAAAAPPSDHGLLDIRAQMNGLGYLSAEWRPGDRVRTWNELPIDRAIPAGTPFEVRVGLVDDGMRRLPIEPEGAGARALDRVGTVRFAVDGRVRAADAELAAAESAWPDADGGRFVVLAAALDRPTIRRGETAVLEIAWSRRWPPAGPDGAKPSAPRDPGAVEVLVAPEGPAAIGPLVVARGVVDGGAPATPMRDKEVVRRRYAVAVPAGWPVGPSSVNVAVGAGQAWRAGTLDVR